MRDHLSLVCLCLAVRLANALVVRTAFVPDEYWQSVEVAHRMVFGYGHLTWEWAAGLRGYAHPTLFAALFWVLRALRLDSAWAVAKGPMLLQALCAAATDISVHATARLLFGRQAARWALACQLLSWFNFYCLPRTVANCLEAMLTSAAAYHWLRSSPGKAIGRTQGSSRSAASAGISTAGRRGQGSGQCAVGAASQPAAVSGPERARRRHQRLWLLLAALAVVARPPCALLWALLGLYDLAAAWQRGGAAALLADTVIVAGSCMVAAALWDRIHYGRWVVVPWEFLRFNLLEGGSARYGAHPWHWNLTQGFPAVAATLLPLMGLGIVLAQDRAPAALAGVSLAVYSLPAHKEFRFLLPALQLAMPYCGPAVSWLRGGWAPVASGSAGRDPPAAGSRLQGKAAVRRGIRRPPMAVATGLALLAGVQVVLALYFSLVQHSGLLRVPGEVQRVLEERGPTATSVLFLTQCHATPWYSHLHHPVPMRFLDCSPPGWAAAVAELNAAEVGWLQLPEPPACSTSGHGCLTQQQVFRRAPAAFLGEVLAASPAPPALVVGYEEQLAGEVGALLLHHGYRPHRRLPNCWHQTDVDTPCAIQLWLRPGE